MTEALSILERQGIISDKRGNIMVLVVPGWRRPQGIATAYRKPCTATSSGRYADRPVPLRTLW
jgi:hypothetical protein